MDGAGSLRVSGDEFFVEWQLVTAGVDAGPRSPVEGAPGDPGLTAHPGGAGIDLWAAPAIGSREAGLRDSPMIQLGRVRP